LLAAFVRECEIIVHGDSFVAASSGLARPGARNNDAEFVMDLAIPREVDAAVCANDHTAAVLSVPLTTIHQPCRKIAATAFLAMLERIANPSIPPRSLTLSHDW
jgi:hypothetical protein